MSDCLAFSLRSYKSLALLLGVLGSSSCFAQSHGAGSSPARSWMSHPGGSRSEEGQVSWNNLESLRRRTTGVPMFFGAQFENANITANPPPEVLSQLNVEAFKEKITSMPQSGDGMCAQGVRLALNELFPKDMGGGPNAKDWTIDTVNRWAPPCFSETGESSPLYQNFDVKILQPNGPGYGHAEVYFEGKWYSDFQQTASLASNSAAYNVAETKIFRVGSETCSSTAKIFNLRDIGHAFARSNILDFVSKLFVTPAWAKASSPDELRVPRKENVVSEVVENGTRWLLVEASENQGIKYELYSVDSNRKTQFWAEDQISAFYLLENMSAQQEVPTSKLVQTYMDNWIKKSGEKAVQKAIVHTRIMTPMQKQAYQRLGFKLADRYSIAEMRSAGQPRKSK